MFPEANAAAAALAAAKPFPVASALLKALAVAAPFPLLIAAAWELAVATPWPAANSLLLAAAWLFFPTASALLFAVATPLPVAAALLLADAEPPLTLVAWAVALAAASSFRAAGRSFAWVHVSSVQFPGGLSEHGQQQPEAVQGMASMQGGQRQRKAGGVVRAYPWGHPAGARRRRWRRGRQRAPGR